MLHWQEREGKLSLQLRVMEPFFNRHFVLALLLALALHGGALVLFSIAKPAHGGNEQLPPICVEYSVPPDAFYPGPTMRTDDQGFLEKSFPALPTDALPPFLPLRRRAREAAHD